MTKGTSPKKDTKPLSRLQDWFQSQHLTAQKRQEYKTSFQQAKPFKYLVINNIFTDQKAVELIQAIAQEEFIPKDADLFQFAQTHDLISSEQAIIQDVRSMLCAKEYIEFMQEITGIAFQEGVVDLAATLYQDTDYLLCHDDKLDNRKIAFLFYFNTLDKKEGGALNLFSAKNNKPDKVTVSIQPTFNTLAFFEVSDISFHEVQEVIGDTQRIALGGWLHAKK